MIEQLETKISTIKKELDDTKENLSRTQLERDVYTQEHNVLADALRRAESQRGELELDLNQMRLDEAKLRDVLVKLQSLNDGLAQDKAELGKIIQELESEKSALAAEKAELELVKASLKAELVKVEQEKHDIENERESEQIIIFLLIYHVFIIYLRGDA